MAQQKVKITIPKGYSPQEREALSLEIIDQIVERTKSGKDKNNKNFTGYSEGYKDSFDFKLSGKSKGKVNLSLSGEMLGALTLLNHSSGSVTIGYTKDDGFNNDKAEGNIKGTYGKKKPIPGKARDFLGISSSELKNITDKYPTKKKGEGKNLDLLSVLLAERASSDLVDNLVSVESLPNEL